MNLVLSGVDDARLESAVAARASAKSSTSLHARAVRFNDVVAGADVRAEVASLCLDARVDHAFVDRAPGFASFGLLAMDMDSTLITVECIDEIADFVGRKSEVAAITEAAMRGEIADFAASLRARVALLAGTDESVLARVFDERVRLTPGADRLLDAARQAGVPTLLVSGGFTYFTERLRRSLAIDAAHANRLEIVAGRLTGRVVEPVFDAEAKATALHAMVARLGLTTRAAIVVGDGSNDIPMMRMVEHSVAYRGKSAAMRAARHAVRFGTLATVVDYFS